MVRMFWVLFIFTENAFSAMPPVESLFRNGSNKDITQETTVLRFKVQELHTPDPLEETPLTERKLFNKYYKIIFHKNRYERIELIQAEYPNAKTQTDSISALYEKRSFFRHITKQKTIHAERDIFWGLLASFALNDSTIISAFLKKSDKNYRDNAAIINQKLKRFYNGHKKYLQTIRDEPQLKATLTSPLQPKEVHEKERVREIMKTPFYTPSSQVRLVKEDDTFFILLELEKIKAQFTNDDFKLVNFSYYEPRGSIHVNAFNYHVVNSTNEVPRNIIFNFFEKKYHVQILSLKHASYRPQSIAKIKKSYRKAQQKNLAAAAKKGTTGINPQRPHFLF